MRGLEKKFERELEWGFKREGYNEGRSERKGRKGKARNREGQRSY